MSNRKKRGRRISMFEVRPGKHRPRNIRNGAIFIALASAFLFVLYTKPTLPGFGKSGTTFTADVPTAVNVRPGSTPIRVRGVDTGQVTKVEPGPDGRGARVTMMVEDGKGVDIRKDASVSFRWRTLLGRNLYVDLNPGSPSAPAIGDTTIPEARTEVQTEVDQAVEPLDAGGQKALKTIVDEFDKGFADASGYRRTVKALGPAMKSLGPGLRSIRGTESGDLQRLIRNTSRMVGGLAGQEVGIAKLIDNGNVALGVTAARAADMRALLSAAPGALAETRTTMARLRTTLDVLDPVAKDLRPGARKLDDGADDASELLTAAAPLLRDAKPTVRALRPAVQDLTKLTTSGNQFMAAINPALDEVIYPILPWFRTTSIDAKVKQFQMIGPLASAATGIVSLGDRYGTVANFEAGFGESAVAASPCQTYITNETVPADQKLQCELVSRILVGLYTGQSPDKVELSGTTVPDSAITRALEDKTKLRAMTKTVLKNKKEAGR